MNSKTKEEVLNAHVQMYFSSDHNGKEEGAEWHTVNQPAENIYKAMDDWAKETAIELLNWMYAGAAETIPRMGRHSSGNMWRRDFDTQYKNSEELYNAFIQSI